MNGRTGNVKRNIWYGLLQVLINALLPFAVRTVLIYRLGVQYLGLNSLFASILKMLSLMEMGFSTAIIFSLYQPVAEGDHETICAYLNHYRRIYRIIGCAILIVGLALMPFLPQLVSQTELPEDVNLYVCYLVFLGNSVIGYLLFGYVKVIPTAYQRRDLISRVNMAATVVRCVLQCLILLVFRSFYLYLFVLPLLTVVNNVAMMLLARRKYPEAVCRGQISADRKRELRKKVSGLFLNKLTTTSRNSIDSLCISAFLGLTLTGIYSNYYHVMAVITMVSGAVCTSMMSSVGNSIVSESRKKNYRDMRRFDFIYTAVAGWAATCLFCLLQPFMNLWTGRELMLGLPEAAAFSVYLYILHSGDIRWVYHEGAGLWWECRYILIGESVANIVLNILLCRFLGVFGILLATIISTFLSNFLLTPIILFRKYFRNGKLREYYADHALYTLTAALSLALGSFLCGMWSGGNGAQTIMIGLPVEAVTAQPVLGSILSLLARLTICTAVYGALFFLLWHRTDRFRESGIWLAQIMRRRKTASKEQS